MIFKRLFDLVFSFLALMLLGWLLVIIYIIASVDTNSNGLFLQKRIGQHGKIFIIFKFKTMHGITTDISAVGRVLRNSKLDELPQLLNVFIGNMSFVGPRPDVPGYFDALKGVERRILSLKPGITGPASLVYFNEEKILAGVDDPKRYNDEIIFPDKVRINLEYLEHKSFWLDIKILIYTLFGKRTINITKS